VKEPVPHCREKPPFPSQTFWIPPNSTGSIRTRGETSGRRRAQVSFSPSYE